jgi:hypothetical protein
LALWKKPGEKFWKSQPLPNKAIAVSCGKPFDQAPGNFWLVRLAIAVGYPIDLLTNSIRDILARWFAAR